MVSTFDIGRSWNVGIVIVAVLTLFGAGLTAAEPSLPSDLSPRQFEPLRPTMRQGGETYHRVSGTNTYRSRRGGVIVVESCDMELWHDFDMRERAWEERVDGGQDGDAVEPARIWNGEPTFDAFRRLLGKRWTAYHSACRSAMQAAWPKLNAAQRREICQIYADPYAVYQTLPAGCRARFDVFNQGYRNLILNPQHQRTSACVFTTRGGVTTHEYFERYPWISLNFANSADRLFIFLRESEGRFGGRTAATDNRLNWARLEQAANQDAGDVLE